MNNCAFSGFVTGDPVVTQTKTGSKVVNFNIAVKDDRKNAIGEYATYYFRIACWGFVADFVQKYVVKDNFVVVVGKLVQGKYKDKATGRTLYAFELVADHVENASKVYTREKTEEKPGNGLTDYINADVGGTDAMYT